MHSDKIATLLRDGKTFGQQVTLGSGRDDEEFYQGKWT
jgi:hypothetical protein